MFCPQKPCTDGLKQVIWSCFELMKRRVSSVCKNEIALQQRDSEVEKFIYTCEKQNFLLTLKRRKH